jgi:hypothetical protein
MVGVARRLRGITVIIAFFLAACGECRGCDFLNERACVVCVVDTCDRATVGSFRRGTHDRAVESVG